MPKLVLDLNDKRPAWSMPSWVPEEIGRALPDEWVLQVMEEEGDGSGDGMVNLGPKLLQAISGAEVYMGYGVPAALLREGASLRWVHSGAAGVRGSLTPEMLESPVLFTNSKGIHGPPMADTALAMMLYFARGLDFGVASQAIGAWDTSPFYTADHPLVEMSQAAVGIFGYGGVGREVAAKALAVGARVLAFDRGPQSFASPEGDGPSAQRPSADPIPVMGQPAQASPAYAPTSHTQPAHAPSAHAQPAHALPVEALWGEDGFRRLMEESDFLILTAPETPETRGAVDAAALRRLKPSAVLINLSRGRLVDEEALIRALERGALRGAGLDVFSREPLSADSPFWSMPNVLVLPHVSAVSSGFWRRQADLILENLRRYLAGEDLLNLVDKGAGF